MQRCELPCSARASARAAISTLSSDHLSQLICSTSDTRQPINTALVHRRLLFPRIGRKTLLCCTLTVPWTPCTCALRRRWTLAIRSSKPRTASNCRPSSRPRGARRDRLCDRILRVAPKLWFSFSILSFTYTPSTSLLVSS